MGIFDIELGKLKVPVYDIGTLTAGFYAGYAAGKGLDTSALVEYACTYGPTAFAVAWVPAFKKMQEGLARWTKNTLDRGLQRGDIDVTREDGTRGKYRDFDADTQRDIAKKAYTHMDELESRIANTGYAKPTMKAGARTAIETTVGYVAGQLYSQVS